MRLHIVMRSYGGENMKGRPDFYDKLTCLASVVRAVEGSRCDLDVTFLNDGPVPLDRLRLMEEFGRVVRWDALGARGSYLQAIRLAVRSDWHDTDVVYLMEDDYLYVDGAFDALFDASVEISEADYFALYARTPANPIQPGYLESLPPSWRQHPPWNVRGTSWVNILSTTSSFGARLGRLRQDRRLLLQGTMWPLHTWIRDHATCLTLGGFQPYSWSETVGQFVGRGGDAIEGKPPARRVGEAVMKVGLNVRSHRRPSRRRMLVAPEVSMAAHLEIGQLPPGHDWASVAETARSFATERLRSHRPHVVAPRP